VTTAARGNVLIVDDDPALRRALHHTLEALGFDVTEVASGEQALREADRRPFDVVLLDLNMPGMGGVEACLALRRQSARVQILMLTVRDAEADRVRALESGADDYVTKPFSVPELVARLGAAVRRARAGSPGSEASGQIVIGAIELDPARRVVRKAGSEVHLTPKEFDLLQYLMVHAGRPIPHARLLQAVWGPEYGGELEYLRTFVRQLRRKLEDAPASPEYLLTEAWVGYRFRAP
jgi:two-component system KDP operon response regulator KdpE